MRIEARQERKNFSKEIYMTYKIKLITFGNELISLIFLMIHQIIELRECILNLNLKHKEDYNFHCIF